ncbi:SusC/RagA family TonB-linked outer membrane protein [Segetibacter aerophilus]|uniref:SusC/RagA family TonB-linked outer membrane protein n=1 Tax=Segetibacter aerophilus TaxID=670293 RepID=A0A512BIG6_9BACT|nr:TonB-dependent receptor [Segetibacter aerophilus]GEO11764.1 SusC/RagA family TonB-linked outer membrane protein [Segetibacter aerophilus]
MKKIYYLLLSVILFPLCLAAQQKVISGRVTDTTGAGLSGVNISAGGARATGTGSTTNNEGVYSISVPSATAELVFSFVGKKTITEPIAGRTVINIVMSAIDEQMADVVVVGYTTQRKETLTGAVSSIKGSDMVRTRNENVLNMLTGKLPGVRVAQRSSRPGAYDATIDIRGMGDPLFVVDGVVRDKGFFSRMSAEEIESVSVLKDGTAAIYGLRAANGVIVVTTKSGRSQGGKVDITFNSSLSMQQYLYVPEGVNATEYMTLRNEQNWQDFAGNYLVRRNPAFTDAQFKPYQEGTKQSYNWMNQVFRKSTPQYDNNLSIDGGSDKLRYYFNLGYTKQEGSYKSGDLKSERWAMRSNIDAQLTKRLKARIQIGTILTNTQEPNGSGWPTYKATWLMRPDAPYYANDNPAYPNGDNLLQYDGNNMIVQTDADFVGLNTNRDKRYNGTLRLEYEIPGIKGLSARGLYDYTMGLPDYNNYRRAYNVYRYNPNDDTYSPIPRNTPSLVEKGTSLNYDRTIQGGLYYTNSFNKHNINSFLLYEGTYLQRDGFLASRELLIESQYLFAGEENRQRGIGQTPFDRASKSVVGSVTYDYGRKYLLDFKFRYDGSSRFPATSRFGFFPAVSAGWRLSEEGFIKNNVNFLSDLKLRASYGELGDDASAGNYPPAIGYNLAGNSVGWYFGDVLNGGVAASSIPNPNLTWYKIKSYNAGLDFGLLQNKLTGTLDVFRRDRNGLLATSAAVIPGTVGANLPQENLNSDRNFGYEVSLTYRSRRQNALSYWATGQISATKYMRTKWLETPANNSYDRWRNRTANRYQNIWWGNESGGMFNSLQEIRSFERPTGQGALPGDWWLNDWNGDGVVDGNDDHPIATTGLPVFNYGLSFGASWRNFDVALDLQGAKGVYVQYSEVLVEALAFGGQNTLTWFMDRWHPQDPGADYFSPSTKWVPGYYPATGHDGRRTGTNGVMNASYMRLKTAELGYTFSPRMLSRVGIKDFRLFVSGYNLLTFTPLKNVDPERPGSAGSSSTNFIDFYNDPITKTYTIGAKLKF